MHWLTMVGILVVAIGTGLMLYGGVVQSRREASQTTERVAEEIQSAMERLEQAQAEAEDDSPEVAEVRDEFAAWAQSFLENRGAKHVAIERARLSTIEEEIELTERARSFLDRVFRDYRWDY